MSRFRLVLVLLVVAEAVGCAALVSRQLSQPAPPAADWARLDPDTAEELRAARAKCASAADWRDLGERYMAAGCFPEAEGCHREAARRAPGDARYARQWAFALERLALLDEANAQYRRAMALDPGEADAGRYFIARNLLRAGRESEAGELFAEGRVLAANRHELARLHLRAGRVEEAARSLQGLLAERPRALQVHLLGYRLAVERGDGRRAFFHADRARHAPEKLHNPFDDEAERIVTVTRGLGPNRRWMQARGLLEAGRFAEARAALEGVGVQGTGGQVAGLPEGEGEREILAEVAVGEGDLEAASSALAGLQAATGPTARVLARIGDVWHLRGDSARGRAAWEAAADLGAGLDLKATHHKLARSFAEAGDRRSADWHAARGHYFVGRDLLRFGHADKAVTYFAAATRADPRFHHAWFYLGEARRLSGDEGAAREAYRECLTRQPGHGRARAALASLVPAARE